MELYLLLKIFFLLGSLVVINNGIILSYVCVTDVNNTYRYEATLPITFNSIYCVLTGVKDTSLSNDTNSTSHRVSWATSGVLYNYTNSSVTFGYIRDVTTSLYVYWYLIMDFVYNMEKI